MPYTPSNDFLIGARQSTEGNRKLYLLIKSSIDIYVNASRMEKAFLRYLVLKEFGGHVYDDLGVASRTKPMGHHLFKKIPIKQAVYRPDLVRVFQNQGKYHKIRLRKSTDLTHRSKQETDKAQTADKPSISQSLIQIAQMARSQFQHAMLYSSIFQKVDKQGEDTDAEDNDAGLCLPGHDDPLLLSRVREWDRIDENLQERHDAEWLPNHRRNKKHTHISNSHLTTLRELKEAPGATTSTSFPPQRWRLGRAIPRVPLCTTLALNDSSTSDQEQVGVVRQTLYSNEEQGFIYYLVSHRKALPYFTYRFSENEIIEMLADGRAYEIKPPPSTTKSTMTSDVYTEVPLVTRGMPCPWGNLRPCPRRYYGTKIEKERAVGELKDRVSKPAVSKRLIAYLEECCAVLHRLPKEQQPDRLEWKTWVPTGRKDRWHVYQHLLLALTTNIENDSIVKLVAPALFMARSPTLPDNTFDNPISVCRDPKTVFRLITMKGEEAVTEGLGKGMVYCNEKAKSIIIASKQVVLKTYARLTNMDEVSVLRKFCHYHDQPSIVNPLPDSILRFVDNSGDTCFPLEYVDKFFKSLYGIGLKMRHLIAEGAYGINYGILLDRHTKRYVVELGLVPASYNDEQMNKMLTDLLPDSLYPALNEIPASISQRLQARQFDNRHFIKQLADVAGKHGWGYHFHCFLRHYPAVNR